MLGHTGTYSYLAVKKGKNFLHVSLVLALSLNTAVAEVPSTGRAPETSAQSHEELRLITPTIYDMMTEAAYNWEGIKAEEKKLEATGHSKEAAIWNSFSVSGGQSHSTTESNSSGIGSHSGTTATSLGAQLTLSLMQWFVIEDIEITEEIQKNALKAARMTEAINLSDSYMNYSNTINQRIYFESIQKILLKFKKMAAEGQLVLTPDTTASLEVAISDIENMREDVKSQYEVARSALRKYLKTPPIDFFAEYQRILELEEDRKKLQPPSNTNGDEHQWNGVEWEEIEKLFPIPKDAETAIKVAKKSPALVISDLQKKQAENQWYLAMASVGPYLNFSFNSTDLVGEVSGSDIRSRSDTLTVALNFRIGGGYAKDLSAKGVLEEAAKFNRKAVQKSIRNSIETSYLRLASIRSNVKITESFIINTIVKNLNKLNPVTSDNLPAVIQYYTSLGQQLRALTELIKAYVLIKASILAQTGTLLEVMPKANLEHKKDLRRKYEERLKKQARGKAQ